MSDYLVPTNESDMKINMEINMELDMDIDKQFILKQFITYAKDVEIGLEGQNKKHCGKYGHWLETKMGIIPNAKNAPDIRGWEMKTGNKTTTFLDKAPSIMYLDGESIPKRSK